MYLEILKQTLDDYLINERSAKPVVIKLTSLLYKTVQFELNAAITLNTDLNITEALFHGVKFDNRTVRLEEGEKLDERFEMNMIVAFKDCKNTRTNDIVDKI